jgi:hypothetical protein
MTTDVYKAINCVQAELATTGIGKDRKNEQQGYKFRGIDDVYNAVSGLLAKNGLCILPRCTERACVERTTAKGNAIFYVTVRAEFDFVAATDGSKHTVVTYGEAMDTADKATNKAMSAAYKYALMQAFAIPTEGDNDADSTTHEVKPTTVLERIQAAEPGNAKRATTDAFDAMPPEAQTITREWAVEVIAYVENGEVPAAYDFIEAQNLDSEGKLALWSQLPSNVRSAVKKEQERRRIEGVKKVPMPLAAQA